MTLLWGIAWLGVCCAEARQGDTLFVQREIAPEVLERMKGKSYPEHCTTPLADLRYLRVMHYNKEGEVCRGELICHKAISGDLLEIFRQLFLAKYPIERMVLVDGYGGDDEASMADNNSSAFNYRYVAGTKRLSKHSRGLAIDINPKYNPYVRKRGEKTLVSPKGSEKYVDRSRDFPYKIDRNDLCYKLFKAYGFTWGGDWRNSKDYQHFEKSLPIERKME